MWKYFDNNVIFYWRIFFVTGFAIPLQTYLKYSIIWWGMFEVANSMCAHPGGGGGGGLGI